jgi:S-methylmethionine-dependent homocysteine/selenocysteine methylase
LVDEATDNSVAYFMVNCAHPTHFNGVICDEPWAARICALRANASCKSHAELDESTTIDIGDPEGLGQDYVDLRRTLKNLNVLGGCCGTDHRHIAAICEAVAEGK